MILEVVIQCHLPFIQYKTLILSHYFIKKKKSSQRLFQIDEIKRRYP